MENKTQRTPNNIFEQILFGIQAVNENLLILSDNINLMHAAVDKMQQALFMPPVSINAEPNTPGAETEEE